MKFNKKIATILLTGALSTCLIVGAAGCGNNDTALKDLEGKVDGYGTSLSGYENKLNDFGNTIDGYESKIEELTSSVDDYGTSLSGYENKIEELTSSVDGYGTSLSGYENKLNDFGNTIDGYESKIEELTSSVDSYKKQLEEMGKLLEEMNNSLKPEEDTSPVEYSEECYTKIKYIDSVLSDRDCIAGENFKLTQKWIAWNLMQAGYDEDDIVYQPTTLTRYYTKETNLKNTLTAVSSYETDGKFYNRSGRNYVEAEDGAYVKVDMTTPNIAITKKGKSEKQIIVGAHYDGDGTGDNGSGVALALTTAEKVAKMELEYTITFVFFTAEEYGCYGSTAYANAMTEKEIANTLYMINLDSLVCGDYAYIYGGVQDNEKKTVTQTEAYDNAMEVANSLGLSLKSNPWTWENPAPGYDEPDYASPSTGDWSDHRGFKNIGIPYVYFEATNWEIPGPYEEYDGYGETYLIGMLMNTKNDYLEYIEKYFPGRIQQHLKTFSTLLYALVTQTEVNF